MIDPDTHTRMIEHMRLLPYQSDFMKHLIGQEGNPTIRWDHPARRPGKSYPIALARLRQPGGYWPYDPLTRHTKVRIVQGMPPWINWHINRGRVALYESDRVQRRYMRMVSHRRY